MLCMCSKPCWILDREVDEYFKTNQIIPESERMDREVTRVVSLGVIGKGDPWPRSKVLGWFLVKKLIGRQYGPVRTIFKTFT